MSSIPQQTGKKSRKGWIKFILFGILGLAIICVVIALISPSEPGTTSETAVPTNTVEPTVIPTETAVPPTPIPEDPREALRSSLVDLLGSSNRNVQRLANLEFDNPAQGDILIQWAINDNLTEDFIKTGIKIDATDLLKTVAQSGIEFNNIYLMGYFPLVDAYGNSKEENVVTLQFSKETVEKINWDGFLYDNIYLVADDATIHPAVQ